MKGYGVSHVFYVNTIIPPAFPGTPVIGYSGDAGFCYYMAKMETAARCGINVVIYEKS